MERITETKDFEKICKDLIVKFYKEEKKNEINEDMVFVVWSSKILQNMKLILSTKLFDGYIFEITYNGTINDIYLDAYKKEKNEAIDVSKL